MGKLVYSVGVNDGSRPSYIDKKRTKQHSLWIPMMQRCFSEKIHAKYPTYKTCEVSDNFKNYSYFYDWCLIQVGFGIDGFSLDKDVVFKGNKKYSEETCFFLPKSINSTIRDTSSKRGLFPIGVTQVKENGRFRAITTIKNKRVSFGTHSTPEDAFYAYKLNMELHLRAEANKWRKQIDPRAYEALMNYSIEITD